MSTKIINIKGFANNNEQFVVKTDKHEIRISTNSKQPELDAPSPVEYVLAGYAGCINIVGAVVAKELNINLRSLKVDISGEINVDKYLGNETTDRAGFKTIQVTVKPDADASHVELQNWLSIVESRCPVYDNLINQTSIKVTLINEFETAEAI